MKYQKKQIHSYKDIKVSKEMRKEVKRVLIESWYARQFRF